LRRIEEALYESAPILGSLIREKAFLLPLPLFSQPRKDRDVAATSNFLIFFSTKEKTGFFFSPLFSK